MSGVRTRFAPSPTGSLHVGNARTAVVNWLIARHDGGAFVLRIEDTDRARNVAGSDAAVMADLEWLGLDWDEGPTPGGEERGDCGPYHQSDRIKLYHHHAVRLLESGAVYRCFCTPAELKEARGRAQDEGTSPGYAGTCRQVDPAAAAERAGAGEPHVLRLATPSDGEIAVEDAIRGQVTFDAANISDFVILRSDGLPTYNFAVVVDDAEMRITHVIRGAGHLSNTPHQVLLYDALGFEPPVFAHSPTVLGEDGSKLSKRSGATPLAALRAEGYHPDAVVNYLSLLGWSSPSEDEVLPRDRLIEEIGLDRMNAADVMFDPDKLRWLSGKHIEAMPLEALEEAVRPWVEESPYRSLLGPRFRTALEAVRSHLTVFGDITDHLAPFVQAPAAPASLDASEVEVLGAVRAELAALEVWESQAIQEAIRSAGRQSGVRGRSLYHPVRLAVTGEEHGPPLAAVLDVRGRQAVLDTLDRAVAARGV